MPSTTICPVLVITCTYQESSWRHVRQKNRTQQGSHKTYSSNFASLALLSTRYDLYHIPSLNMHWESYRLPIFGQIIMFPLFAWTLQSSCVEQFPKEYPNYGRRDKRDKVLLSLRPEPDILQTGVPTATSVCQPSLPTTLRYTSHSCLIQHLLRLQLQTSTSSEKAAAAQPHLR